MTHSLTGVYVRENAQIWGISMVLEGEGTGSAFEMGFVMVEQTRSVNLGQWSQKGVGSVGAERIEV